MLDRIEFLVGEAFVALKRNGRMTFAAISTCAVALFLLGGLGYTYLKVSEFAEAMGNRFEMRVYLKDGTDFKQITETAATMRAIPNVKSVNWIPRDKAWELMKQKMPEYTEGLDNPLPDAFKVTVKDLNRGAEVADAIRALDTVAEKDGVVYLDDEQRMVGQFLQLVRWAGIGLGGLLFITAGVLIYNTIRLTIMSRRLEIRIMRLVGATHSTIQIPLILEGAVQGMLGGCLASFMLLGCHAGLNRSLQTMSALGKLPPFPTTFALVLLGTAGAAYGLFCSSLALREPIKFS
ncbi:MAG: ABC transporter permease [Fimbriimonadaceae bacterium]|nr:ABC transporter permease [Chthonomonadaceae bacterium]MCO5295633.1 ABC transporter permease [Fimbriimonadaceae bacterium]